MTKQPVTSLLAVLATLALLLPAAVLADDAPPPLAAMWVITPKEGQDAEFRKALAEHMAFRSEHGDPRTWKVYTPVLGEELNRYAIRFCCFNWADQDGYEAWMDENSEIRDHLRANLSPLTGHVAHYMESYDWADSHWPNPGTDYRFYAVTDFHIKPGKGLDFTEARSKMSQIALNQGWASDQRAWIWSSTIGGKPVESIIIPHPNYASFDRGEETFVSFLTRHLGEEEASELVSEFAETAYSTDFQIWEYHEDLSMSDDD